VFKRSFRDDNSGQVIIVSALLIAVLLLSTALYVVETTKQIPTVKADDAVSFQEYKQAARSTLISALANVTAGGDSGILSADLSELKSELQAHSYSSILNFAYTPQNSGSYINGLWISWGNNGLGVSSAYVDFAFASSSSSSSANVQYAVNITSKVTVSGSFTQENDTKTVNLTLNIRNEDKPALTSALSFQYLNESSWLPIENPEIVSHNNGSYVASFTVPSSADIHALTISVLCVDQRGISIGANYTCAI
jgi:hypothetical protein